MLGLLGDVHGDMASVFRAFQVFNKLGVTRVIQVGDFWMYSKGECIKLDRIAKRYGIEYLDILRGNHEDYNYLGDLIHKPGFHHLSEHLRFMGDGTWFMHDGVTFSVIGGAVSRDTAYRTLGKTYWHEERMNQESVEKLQSSDVLLSHDTSRRGMWSEGLSSTSVDTVTDLYETESRELMARAEELTGAERMIHGHFHGFDVNDRYACLGMNGTYGHAAVLNLDNLDVYPVEEL